MHSYPTNYFSNKLLLLCIIILVFGHVFDLIFILDLHKLGGLEAIYNFYFSADPAYGDKQFYTHAIVINSVFFMFPISLLMLLTFIKNSIWFSLLSLVYFGALVCAFIIWGWMSNFSPEPIMNWPRAIMLSLPLVLASILLAINAYKTILKNLT